MFGYYYLLRVNGIMANKVSLKKAGKSKSWQIMSAVQPLLLPKGEQVRYSWYGYSSPNPIVFIVVAAFVVLLSLLLGLNLFNTIFFVRLLVGMVFSVISFYLFFKLFTWYFKSNRKIVSVTDSKHIFVFESSIFGFSDLKMIGQLRNLKKLDDFDGWFKRDVSTGDVIWIPKDFYKEIESAQKYLS